LARDLPAGQRRVAEEAVRRGLAAAVVMEAAAREWVGLEGEETFPEYLVRREVIRREALDALSAELAAESGGEAVAEAGGEPGEPARAPHPSEVIKGYRILERLGRGGMGSVYRAEQAGMNRTVALKILRRPLGENPEHVERLKREARLVGALDHPNIVRGLDVGQHGPYHYFAMEFVEGETLRDVLKKRGIVPEAEALRIVEQVCLALDHAYTRGIVHRDVKPGNIIVTPDGTPKLTDYGLAKGPADFTLTQSGVTVGTPQYISPEQARDPAGVDVQTDLYSLGATAYHMLAGVPPHTSDTLAGLLTKVLYEKPRTARQVNPKVSQGASFLVEKLMAKQKRHRYREPREVLRDLRSLAAGKSIVPRNWAGDFDVHEARRQKRLIMAGAGFLVVAAIGATVGLQYRTQRQNRMLLEEGARTALRVITEREQPRFREAWDRRIADLGEYLAKPEYRGTAARATAEREYADAVEFLKAWLSADEFVKAAKRLADEREFRRAIAELEETAIPGMEKLERFGREPVKRLRKEVESLQEAGVRAAEAEAQAQRERAEKATVVVWKTARSIEAAFEDALERCRGWYNGPDLPMGKVEELEGIARDLRAAKSRFETSLLNEAYLRRKEQQLEADQYAAVEEELKRVARTLETDVDYQNLLNRLPAPAAADFRGRVAEEMERARTANRAYLKKALADAQRLADAGDFDGAIAVLDVAGNASMSDLRIEAASAKEATEARRATAEAEAGRAEEAFFAAFLKLVETRDFDGARRMTTAASDKPGLARAAASAGFALHLVEEQVLERVRRHIRDGGPLREGLQFADLGKGQPYRDVSNVRLEGGGPEQVVAFDEPGQKGLRGLLRLMSLRLLFVYSGLDRPGLEDPPALVRALLLIATDRSLDHPGRPLERARLEAEKSRLGALRESFAPAVPLIRALVAHADGLIVARISVEEDKEAEAARLYERAGLSLDAGDPLGALRDLELLQTEALKNTRFVAEKRAFLQIRKAQALQQVQAGQVLAVYPGTRIEELGRGAGEKGLTRVFFDFSDEKQMKGFLPPGENRPVLYRWVPDETGAGNGGEKGGRVVFLLPPEGVELADSPLTLPCVFKTGEYMSLQFTIQQERPLLLQVSVAGNHVDLLTDDGRITSGRGVHAWQGEAWRFPDRVFPDHLRHEFLPKTPAELNKRWPEGLRHFQLEPGRHEVRVEWTGGHLKLAVDGADVWDYRLPNPGKFDRPPRFRILTYTGATIDDLELKGVVDREALDALTRPK
jgi:hypothetical protein